MGKFYQQAREISHDTIQLLEDFVDSGLMPKESCETIIQDHQDVLRGVTDISIIVDVFTSSHQFLHAQMENFKAKTQYTDAVLCKVMAGRLRDLIVDSLRETQPIEVQPPDKKK